MNRFKKEDTPLERRRLPKGAARGGCKFQHSDASRADLAELRARWGLSEAATLRRALAEQVKAGV